MQFKVGDKVKFTKRALKNMLHYNSDFRKIKNIGVVIKEGQPYTKVSFGYNIWWIQNRSLELIIKNQQLLFDFMG